MIPLRVHELRHRYPETPVLNGIDLTVQPGELVTALGASGCGKTTLLRAIAGLLTPTSGSIEIGGAIVVADGRERVPVERRRVGLVFQEYALFPQMTVAANVGFGVGDDTARVDELLALVGLSNLAGRRPAQLSGGQQQRVALARALAPRPHVLLMDEPFSNVDAQRRAEIGRQVRETIRAEGAAALLVTHDREQALRLADRVAVLVAAPSGAVLAQLDTPQMVYRRPCSAEVAHLTGPAFLLSGEAAGETAETALGTVRLVAPRQGTVEIVLRPESVRFVSDSAGPHSVVENRFIGRGWELDCQTPAGVIAVCDESARSGTGRVEISGAVWALPER